MTLDQIILVEKLRGQADAYREAARALSLEPWARTAGGRAGEQGELLREEFELLAASLDKCADALLKADREPSQNQMNTRRPKQDRKGIPK